jgi:hypothetical protein
MGNVSPQTGTKSHKDGKNMPLFTLISGRNLYIALTEPKVRNHLTSAAFREAAVKSVAWRRLAQGESIRDNRRSRPSLRMLAVARVLTVVYHWIRAHWAQRALRPFWSILFICVTLTGPVCRRSPTRCSPPTRISMIVDHDELGQLPLLPGRQAFAVQNIFIGLLLRPLDKTVRVVYGG